MNKALWTAQVLLGFAFLMGGQMKVFTAHHALARDMAWIARVPAVSVTLMGLLEVLAAIGLVLPSALVYPQRYGSSPG